MAYQSETPTDWPANVYQVGVTDPVLGGVDGPVNIMGAALAKRSLYQRMRNVTPWSADLAAAHGYPAGACVRHGATTWRAIVDNAVAPGTDPTRWERWGYSEKELAAYLRGSLLSPVRCPVTGPAAVPSDAIPYTMWKSVAPYNEYWMWMGDAWKVVSCGYSLRSTYTFLCGLNSAFYKQTPAPRDGRIICMASANYQAAASSDTAMVSVCKGLITQSTDHANAINGATWLTSGSCSSIFDVVAGDLVGARFHMTGSNTSDRTIGLTVDYRYLD